MMGNDKTVVKQKLKLDYSTAFRVCISHLWSAGLLVGAVGDFSCVPMVDGVGGRTMTNETGTKLQ